MTTDRTPAGEVVDHVGEGVLLRGWVDSVSIDQGWQRIVLRDRSGFAALVAAPDPDVAPDVAPEAAIEVLGTVVDDGAGDGPEVRVEELRVVGPVRATLPLSEDSPLEE